MVEKNVRCNLEPMRAGVVGVLTAPPETGLIEVRGDATGVMRSARLLLLPDSGRALERKARERGANPRLEDTEEFDDERLRESRRGGCRAMAKPPRLSEPRRVAGCAEVGTSRSTCAAFRLRGVSSLTNAKGKTPSDATSPERSVIRSRWLPELASCARMPCVAIDASRVSGKSAWVACCSSDEAAGEPHGWRHSGQLVCFSSHR